MQHIPCVLENVPPPCAHQQFCKWYIQGGVIISGACENGAKLAQKLGQPQPFLAAFPPECTGRLASSGHEPGTFLAPVRCLVGLMITKIALRQSKNIQQGGLLPA